MNAVDIKERALSGSLELRIAGSMKKINYIKRKLYTGNNYPIALF